MFPKRSAIDSLLEKKWTLADSQQHLLGNLQGKSLNSYRLVVLLGAKNRIGASYFQVFLQNPSGEVSSKPVVIGLHNRGRYPSYNWIEVISLFSLVGFASEKEALNISTNGLAHQLLQYLADLIPPGGHLMVEYDSPEQQDTARSLALGIPPVATPLGYLMFSIGCGTGFKDWYFAESGAEGPRKLQGYKALNKEHAQIKTEEMIRELTSFLDGPLSAEYSELVKAARNRALALLGSLR